MLGTVEEWLSHPGLPRAVSRWMMEGAAGDGPDAVCRSDAMQVSGGAGM